MGGGWNTVMGGGALWPCPSTPLVGSLTHGGGDAAHRAGAGDGAGDGGGLSGGCSLGRGRLLLHLAVTLAEVKDLEEGDVVGGTP